ncbi:MAG TPA: GNAT family N-acetyltransferase [Actinomycetota bacterium]|nr:GNAT family N-acetyltransferase [Actinomycetota bacterium]
MSIQVRPLSSLDEIAAADAVFDQVWHAPDRERLPRELLRAMTAHTNLLIGAFDGDTCVGVVTGWWGRDDDAAVWLWSARLGVLESHRRAGVATTLKREQARVALERGVNEIRWTFDPMRARNAAFNMRTLGARAIAYLDDVYGPRQDRFNAGERTDRLLVSWTPHRPAPAGNPPLTRVRVPAGIDEYLSWPMDRRRDERDRVRRQMRSAFEAGLVVTGFEPPGTYLFGGIA